MKVINFKEINAVECPNGGFSSKRMLLKKDNMGFTMTRTALNPRGWQTWHYKNHLESCYCISGKALLKDEKTGAVYDILPGVLYALDKNDKHSFKALKRTVLICVFNPALEGTEVHEKDGSYKSSL
jgi:L-ectoine synthase